MTLHRNAFKPIHLKASLKAGLLISFCAHTAVAGAMMWFGSGDPAQSKQEEFEALEAKSVAVNALSMNEVRALIAALENPDAPIGEATSPGIGGESAAAMPATEATSAPAPEATATKVVEPTPKPEPEPTPAPASKPEPTPEPEPYPEPTHSPASKP
ncbi:MAG: hypothetical protein QF614_06950, partial [SAR324 cluster bacterium]|nr:hypothetical protein [SAR324 cluster bacterium]